MQQFAFGPRNYKIMWVGLAVLAAGFVTMMAGDKDNYGEDFMGITLGPILLVTGFVIEFFAIMARDNSAVVSDGVSAAIAVPGTAETPPAVTTSAPAAPAYKRM